MPLIGDKSHENTGISSPVEGHPITVSQPLVTKPAITSDRQDPSTKLSNSNEPISKAHAGIAKPSVDHTTPQPNADRGVEAGTLPAGVPPHGPTPGSQEWQKQQGEATQVIIEEKMPFKDQVKAWAKVHRGTILRDHEQKELGQKILAGEVPPQ